MTRKLLIVSIGIVLVWSGAASALQFVINPPRADVFIRKAPWDTVSANTSYLKVGHYWNGQNTVSYLKFGLSGIAPLIPESHQIVSAQLKLWQYTGRSSYQNSFKVFHTADSWSERTIYCNDFPDPDHWLGTTDLNYGIGGWKTLDLSEGGYDFGKDVNDGWLSLAVTMTDNGAPIYYFGSKETGYSYIPKLCLETQSVPEPATVFLLGSGLVGLGVLLRRRNVRR